MFLDLIAKTVLKQKKKDPNKLVARKPDEDFIPYVCHYNPHTILTKDGELMQIIRVTGFNKNSVASELISLRDAVRDAIVDNIKEEKFAFWFNTIRRKKDISPSGEFDDFFGQKVHDEWIKDNKWDDQYVNELYISIIIEGLDTSISNLNSFIRSLSYTTTKSLHKGFLQDQYKELTKVTKAILNETKDYGAKLLGIKQWEGTLYSEPIRFFGKIVNLHEDRFPLSVNDISSDLATHKMAFGDRELQVVGDDNSNFAAMLSLKEYFEVSPAVLDHILQLPFEFVITQSFDFFSTKKELEPYQYQDYLLQVSGDEEFRQLSGVANFVECDKGNATDYGKLQTTIMVISPTVKKLEEDLEDILEQFNELGFVVVREDIFSQHCFWSQLPGNFRYLNRQKIINTLRVGGFAALHSFPTGNIAGNLWGPAVCAFKTVLDTPYFFNFHDGEIGHGFILGEEGSGKTTLVNFLVTNARKFGGQLFILDSDSSSTALVNSFGGTSYKMSLDDEKNDLFLNPILAKNKEFLVRFFNSLICFSEEKIAEEEIAAIDHIIDKILSENIADFFSAVELFNNEKTPTIYQKLQVWESEGLDHVFGYEEEINFAENKIANFDLKEFAGKEPILAPIAIYLLHRIEELINPEEPSIIILDEAWNYLDNEVLGSIFADFLQRMREKNTVVLLVNSDIEKVLNSEYTPKILAKMASQIYMPITAQLPENFQEILSLSNEEMEIIEMMDIHENHFLLKREEDSVISYLNLEKHLESLKIFSSDENTIKAMDEILVKYEGQNANPSQWMPELFTKLQEIEEKRIADLKEEARKARVEELKLLKNGD